MSRSIGDHTYKKNKDIPLEKQAVTYLPDVIKVKRHPDEDEFILIASDGLWDVRTNE